MATVTSAVKVHEPLAGMVPPLNANVEPEGTAVAVPPVQVVLAFAGLAMVIPLGKLSVTLTSVITVVLGLVKVTVRVVFPPAPNVAGAKAFVTEGPLNPLLTAVTTNAVPGPVPSGSIVAEFKTVPPVVAATLNWIVAAFPNAITPADWLALLISAVEANGMVLPAPSATATPFTLVLPAT